MDQCVCTKQNDTSRYAGVGESLGSSEHQGALLNFFFIQQRLLDWFHISMRVRYLEQIIRGLLPRSETEQYTKKALQTYVNKLRWCFWHANAVKAEQRMRQISLLCRIVVPQTLRFARSLEQLDYRLGELFAYLESNYGSTIAYGKHYREHKPISTAMAESAVNQVVNAPNGWVARVSIQRCAIRKQTST